MANSYRTAQKRKLDSACNDLTRAMRQLREVSAQYIKPHPEIGKALSDVSEVCADMYTLIHNINSQI